MYDIKIYIESVRYNELFLDSWYINLLIAEYIYGYEMYRYTRLFMIDRNTWLCATLVCEHQV